MGKNAIVGQSGGPTSVINASLAGVFESCKSRGADIVYGMCNGVAGLLEERVVDLSTLLTDDLDIELLKRTPSSFLGSCRYKLPDWHTDEAVYKKLFAILEKLDIGYFFYIGGNDSMDTIGKLAEYGECIQSDIRFMGVPKTIDNDLMVTDHTPGYGSAAKYIGVVMKEIIRDATVYGTKYVTVVEIMGRNAGWLTAAAALAKSGAKLESKDIVSPLWESLTTRPSLPNTPCELLTVEQTGATAAQRIAMVRDELKKAGATALAVTGLDCVGWLTNMRARDLPCTPLAVAYALVTMDSCTLFIAPGRLNDADAKTLADNGVSLRDYPELIDTVHALPAEEVFLVDEKTTNYDLYCALNEHKTVTGADPIFALKGVKNPVELANIRECHVRDGVAMVRFQMDLEKAIAEGKILHETDIEKMLQKRRAEMPGYFEDSFDTIAAYGPNAAMMHYHAEGEVDSVIEPRGFLLVDNGGQYDCGTTDITRTYPVGPLTENERKYYTWTLQSHIDIARAVFLDYCTGFALDSFARGPLWAHKINYRCGTGHGVGYISSVHEGPQSLRPQNPIVFKEGMTITDEPGVYETDEVGIRIENELECVDAGTNQYGHWLKFEPLTLVPISTEPVIVDELTRDQINWLNAYHAHVYEMLSPRLTEEEKTWLKAKTAPIDR